MFFLARKQYPVRYSPTSSNCNLQLRTGFFADPVLFCPTSGGFSRSFRLLKRTYDDEATGPRNCPRAPITTVKSAGAITNRDFRTKPFHCDCLIGSFAKVGVRAIGRVVAEIQSLVLDSTQVSEADIDLCSQNTTASFFSVARLLYSLSNRPTTWHHCGTCLLLGVPQFRRMPKLSRHQTKAARRATR